MTTTSKGVMLDTGPLGRIAHHRPRPEMIRWLDSLLNSGMSVYLAEIADYELRRSFLLHNLTASLAVLDAMRGRLKFRPITSTTMLTAAQLWADARLRGTPTADPKELDGDVILAAQAIEADAMIATNNVAHLAQFVPATTWDKIQPQP